MAIVFKYAVVFKDLSDDFRYFFRFQYASLQLDIFILKKV